MKQTKRILSMVLCLLMLIAVVPVMEANATCCRKDSFDKSKYTLTGDMAYDVAMIAKSQKGRTCTDFGYSGVDYGAWCDEYVADCIENAGGDDSIVAHGGTVADFESKMRARGAVEVTSPKAGDLVFFTWSHVEIITKVENGVPYCAGGNNGSSPGCCNGERKVSSVGSHRLYLRPNYPSITPTSSDVRTDETLYPFGSKVKITWDACTGATSYNVVIWKAGERRSGEWIDAHQVLSKNVGKATSYTYSPPEDGGYTIILQEVGLDSSTSCKFVVNPQAINLGEDFFAEIVNTSTSRIIGNYDNNVQASSNEANDPRLIWHFMRNSDGSYLVYNAYNGTLLTAENGGTSNGDNIVCQKDYDGACQHWVVTKKNGVYCLVSSSGNKLMSLKGASPEPGTNVYLWDDNGTVGTGTAAQGFSVVKKTDYAKPDAPDASKLSISSLGSTLTDTVFKWTASPVKSAKYDQRIYNLRIWQGSELGENGTEYKHVLDLTDTTCSVRLPKGKYTAYLTAVNTKYHWYSTPSNSVTFTIGDHTHSWKGVVTSAATCTATGTKTFTCSCGASYTETIAKLGHSYGAWTKLNDTQHQRVCSRNSSHVEKANHTWNAGTVTKAATCVATGVKTYTCTVCKATKTETIAVNASNHMNKTNVAATASTCTVKGYTAGVYCNDCKKYISGHAEQPLAAHKTTTQNAKAATCTAEGYTGDQVCTVCKQTITKGTAIAKKAHSLTMVNKAEASCTTAGYTGDQVCTVCKQTITKGSAIAALGHANADSNGNCTRCGTHIKDVTPSQPSNPQPNPNACKYCGKVHTGPFGWLIKFFHSILAIFKR